MLSLGARFVLAIVWVVAVIGAGLEIPLGFIWALGGIGDNFDRPEPSVANLLSLAGVAICFLAIALFTTLIWRIGPSFRVPPDRGAVELTAKRVAGIAIFLIALGVITDFVRSDGTLIGTPALAILNAPSLAAVLLLIGSRRLIR